MTPQSRGGGSCSLGEFLCHGAPWRELWPFSPNTCNCLKLSNKMSPWVAARLAENYREKYLLIQTVGWALRKGCCEATGISEGSRDDN